MTGVGSGLQAVAAATAAVLVAGRRVGSAVLVDGRHLLTAGHVLGPAEQARVGFPSGPVSGIELPARRLALPAEVSADVAVLDLGDPLPPLPPPVRVWPARRLPQQVHVLGFPAAERQASGVWRQFAVAGPVADGRVQLDWARGVGTLPGHSGGPVVAAADDEVGGGGAALVGVLVEGSAQGQFDRFVPVTAVAQCWPGLPRPWLLAGAQARSHFHRRARGQRSHARGGDLFRGRHQALTAVQEWLTGAEPPGQPLVVTGQPGAGKSSVVARVVLALEAAGVGPGLAFHARGATHDDVLRAVADLTGYAGELARDALLDALAAMAAPPPGGWLIVCDGLDEAANPTARQHIADTLTELAVLPAVRVVVATRPLAAGDWYAPDALLPALGVGSAASAALVDLDTDGYFDPDGLRDFAAALLAQDGVDRPGPPAKAWTVYRGQPALCQRMAAAVAGRARRNYLVAALAAAPLSTADHPVDPGAAGFDSQSLPSQVGEALGKYLEPLPEDRQTQTRGLLTAVAYARGDGIDDRLWLRFAAVLGYPATLADLDRLRAGGAADYLLQTVPDDAGPRTRLFHQALSDELLARRHRHSDEGALLTELQQLADAIGWAKAPRYLQQHAADHATAAGQLEVLLDDVGYLAVADFTRLLPLLPTGSPATPPVVLLHQAGARATALPPDRRLSLLALTAAHLGLHDLHRRLAANPRPLGVRWAHRLGIPHRELTGHTSSVEAVAVGRAGDRDIIVSGSLDGTVRIWDATTGTPVGAPLTGHTSPMAAVAVGRAGDHDIIVSGSHDHTVRIWDATSQRCETILDLLGPVTACAFGPPGLLCVAVGVAVCAFVVSPSASTVMPRSASRLHRVL